MTVLGTDDFNRPDSDDMGADWEPVSTDFARNMAIFDGRAIYFSPSTNEGEVYLPAGILTDGWVEIVVTAEALAVGAGYGITLRSTIGQANRNFYRLCVNASGYAFVICDDESFTTLASGTDTTFANGDTLYFGVQGDTFTAKKNSTLGVGGTTFGSFPTNSTITSGYFGIAFSPDGGNDPGPGIESFVIGNFSSGSASRAPRRTDGSTHFLF